MLLTSWFNIRHWEEKFAMPMIVIMKFVGLLCQNSRNYLIFYMPFQSTILVIRVLHAAQDWTRFFGGPPPS